MKKLPLDGIWKFREVGSQSDWQNATVPGSIYMDLLDHEQIPDPFFRDNEEMVRKISEKNFEYERSFFITEKEALKKKITLVCEGLDTLATIKVNGQIIDQTKNMHRRYQFEVEDYLKAGENIITIIFDSPIKYIKEKQKEFFLWGFEDNMVMSGHAHIRKAHYMYGWDWGPQLPDMGIWRSIYLTLQDKNSIQDVYIRQIHKSDHVDLNIEVTLERIDKEDCECQVQVLDANDQLVAEQLFTIETKSMGHLRITQPELWWPNGYGAQPLYKVLVKLVSGTETVDEYQTKIGLRTIKLATPVKEDGKRHFYFEVNGVPIFAMGANYIPEDNILARSTPETTRQLIQDSLDANFNMLRVWGGGIYPPDYFYEICDEKGILVWQDFMYACTVYRLDAQFQEEVVNEAIDNIKRLRNHASLALWCGNNEIESMLVGSIKPENSNGNYYKYRSDYVKIFEFILPELVKEYNGDIDYWSSSPSSGGDFDRPTDILSGDTHYWGVWHGQQPITAYEQKMPFVSEYGFLSFPDIKTIDSYTWPSDRVYGSYILDEHVKASGGSNKSLTYVMNEYKYPAGLEQLVYIMQCMQGEALKCGIEYWRQNRGTCMGSLYWQINDCYPVASWSTIDSKGRWKAAHYYVKRAYAPLLISSQRNGNMISVHLSNETRETKRVNTHVQLIHLKKGILKEWQEETSSAGLSSDCLLELDISPWEKEWRQIYLSYHLELEGDLCSAGTRLFVPTRYFDFEPTRLSWDVEEQKDQFVIQVKTENFTRHIELRLTEVDGIFSDNYFDLNKGESRTITLNKKTMSDICSLEAFKAQLILQGVQDSF